MGRVFRHCEEQSDDAIQIFRAALDCFAALAMTISNPLARGQSII
jgi:hypothetical protein